MPNFDFLPVLNKCCYCLPLLCGCIVICIYCILIFIPMFFIDDWDDPYVSMIYSAVLLVVMFLVVGAVIFIYGIIKGRDWTAEIFLWALFFSAILPPFLYLILKYAIEWQPHQWHRPRSSVITPVFGALAYSVGHLLLVIYYMIIVRSYKEIMDQRGGWYFGSDD